MTGLVLIIEDEPDIAEALRYSLERAGFETRTALTGEDGLKASLDHANPPCLILLDLLLPGMSGAEICRRLRCEPATQDIPILIMTAKAMENDINTSLRAGANDFILKPFSIREVVAKVCQSLSGAGEQVLTSSSSPTIARSATQILQNRDVL